MAPIKLPSIEKIDNIKVRKTPSILRPNVLPTASTFNNKYIHEGIGSTSVRKPSCSENERKVKKTNENNRKDTVPRDKLEKKQPNSNISNVKTAKKINSPNVTQKDKATPKRNGDTFSTARNSSPKFVPKVKQMKENSRSKKSYHHQNGNSSILTQHDGTDAIMRSMTQKEKQTHNLQIFKVLSIKGPNAVTKKVCQYTRQMASNANGVMYTQSSVSFHPPNPSLAGVEQNNHQPSEETTVPEETTYNSRLEEVVKFVASQIVDSIRAVAIHNGERIRSEVVHEARITDQGKETIVEYVMNDVGETIKLLLDVLNRKENLFSVLTELVNQRSFIHEDDVADIVSRISKKFIHPPTPPTDQKPTRSQDMENIEQISQAETVHWPHPPSGNPPSRPEPYVANDSNDQWRPVSKVDSLGTQDLYRPMPISVSNWNFGNAWQISPQEPGSVKKNVEYAPGVTIQFPISCGETQPMTINWRPMPCRHNIPCSSPHSCNRLTEAGYAREQSPQWPPLPPRAASRQSQTLPMEAQEPPPVMTPNSPGIAGGRWSNSEIDFSEWLALGRRLFETRVSGSGDSGYTTPDSGHAEMRDEPKIPAYFQPTFMPQGANQQECDNLRTFLQNGPGPTKQERNAKQENWQGF